MDGKPGTVLKEIARKFGSRLPLNCYVIQGGEFRVGDSVELVKDCQHDKVSAIRQ